MTKQTFNKNLIGGIAMVLYTTCQLKNENINTHVICITPKDPLMVGVVHNLSVEE